MRTAEATLLICHTVAVARSRELEGVPNSAVHRCAADFGTGSRRHRANAATSMVGTLNCRRGAVAQLGPSYGRQTGSE